MKKSFLKYANEVTDVNAPMNFLFLWIKGNKKL